MVKNEQFTNIFIFNILYFNLVDFEDYSTVTRLF